MWFVVGAEISSSCNCICNRPSPLDLSVSSDLVHEILGQMCPRELKLKRMRGIVLGGPRRILPTSGDFKTRNEVHETGGVDRAQLPRAPVDEELVEAFDQR